MLSEAQKIKRAIERVADAEIQKLTAPCLRVYKAKITEAPNGTTCKVKLIGDDTILTLPYASKLSGLTVGTFVWVAAFYATDNSFSNALVWDTLKFDSDAGGGLCYVEGSGSIAAVTTSPYYAAQWKGTSQDITSLYTGLTIIYKLDVAGNGTYGTLLDINGLGAHPVVRNATTMVGTSYPINTPVIMTYDADLTGNAYINDTAATTIQGVWSIGDTASTAIYQFRKNSGAVNVKSTAGTLYRYMLCMTDMNGEIIPFNNTSNARTTYTKVMNTAAFDPFGFIYLYYTTTTVAANNVATASVLYRQLAYDIRYSLNINSSGTAGTTALTANKPVYIRALYDPATGTATFTQNVSSSSYLERSSIVQELPTSDPNTGLTDNKFYIYIFLGQAYSKYQVELCIDHPVYYWNSTNNCIKRFFG